MAAEEHIIELGYPRPYEICRLLSLHLKRSEQLGYEFWTGLSLC